MMFVTPASSVVCKRSKHDEGSHNFRGCCRSIWRNLQRERTEPNEGYKASVPSGSEARSAVTNSPTHVAGTGKFCKPRSVNGPLNCFYMTMKACEQHNKSNLYAASQIRMRERSSHDIGPKGTINSTDLVTASAIASAAWRYWPQWSAPESRVRNLAAESFKE
jgi:hypothetical protein